MILTDAQRKKLKEVYLNAADEGEIEKFFETENIVEGNRRLSAILFAISEGNKKQENTMESYEKRFVEMTSTLDEGVRMMAGKMGKSVEQMGLDLAEKLLEKLDETNKNLTPKDQSPLFQELYSLLRDIKEVLALYAAVTAGQMKNLKRLYDGWYGGGQTFEFVRLDGAVDSSNTVFTIPATKSIPRSDAIVLVWNAGQFQQSAEGDWTRVDGTFTFTFPPAQTPAVLYEK